ncbi:hypothetical protein FPC62_27080 [Salmonella enterica]|nr:hypothetical protein [Salmonella enterica]EDD5837532.1 hypothetical protein [Salmonella enterica subsp. enterica serovar Enteritidis]EGC1082915.1 hypothetical protein [Salmonella enterica]EHX4808189.1 hypothetical protein [Salmonella enterica]
MGAVGQKWVSFESERECRFALHWLNIVAKQNLPPTKGSNLDMLNHQINEILNKLPVAGTHTIRLNDILRDLELAVKDNILTEAELQWLNRNRIVTLCFCWLLRTQQHAIFFHDPTKQWGNPDNIISTLSEEEKQKLFAVACTSQEERLKWIIQYLDSIIITRSDITYTKSELLNKIKNRYINERQIRLSPQWLVETNEDACKWAWLYIVNYQKKYFLKKNTGILSITNPDWSFTNNYSPDESDPGEYILAVHAAFELWSEGDDARELFINKMNRSWNQYSLRHSRRDKKPVNCYVDRATKKKLEKYCKLTKRTITEVIETLINTYCNPPF